MTTLVRRPPDLTGKGHPHRFVIGSLHDDHDPNREPWSAWQYNATAAARERWPAAIGMWFLHAPGAHPLWSWHVVTAVHLRDVEGQPPAHRATPASTHELMILAVDPAHGDPDVDDPGQLGPHLLKPPNMAVQVEDATDEMIDEMLRLLARAFVNGISSPDDDYREDNAAMVLATLEHMRQGRHLPS